MFRPVKILIFTVTLAVGFALTLPASAEPATETKPKKQVVAPTPNRANASYQGQDKFRAGPLYYDKVYLGDDPDPFIRFQINRDLSAKLGGNQ
jgi:hypothetical protein